MSEVQGEQTKGPPSTSHITGKGYGDAHDWRYLGTPSNRVSRYECASCRQLFFHNYPATPGIFEAMFFSNVPARCGDRRSTIMREGVPSDAAEGGTR